MASRKVTISLAIRSAITSLDNLVTELNELDDMFINSGYDSEGTNPIVDEDIEGHDMVAADLAAVHTFVEQINLFLNDGEPIQFDYASAIDKFRNMPWKEQR